MSRGGQMELHLNDKQPRVTISDASKVDKSATKGKEETAVLHLGSPLS